MTKAVDDGQQQCDISGLLEMLGKVTDRRSRRSLVYELVFVLALTLVAVLAGASNFRQISGQIADFPRPQLAKLGAKWCYFRGDFARPSERTVRRILEDVDADELDSAVGEWLRENARRDGDGVLALAIDGKVLKGAWTDENETFTLFSAMIHDVGVTVAQRQVPAGTNEITQVEDLMAGVSAREGEHVVVTMDALVFRSFRGRGWWSGGDTPVGGLWILGCHEGSIGGVCTTLVRVIRRCFPMAPYRPR